MKSTVLAIQLTMQNSTLQFFRIELNNQHDQAFEHTTNDQSMVLMIASDDLEHIHFFKDQIVDRGVKDARKGLGSYLLGYPKEKIPLIDTAYSSLGRLKYGVSKLIEKLAHSEGCKCCIIGVPYSLFKDLWQQAEESEDILVKKWDREEPVDQYEDNSTTELGLLSLLKKRHLAPASLTKSYVGNAESVQLVRQLVLAAAESDVPVLITGDTGTGKEVVARTIHEQSSRRQYSFTAINCGAIPRELLELELFGCEEGAIEKGYRTKIGLWQSVGRGTLFLDEIGELSLEHQVKILRALQENKIRRIGGTEDITVHARVLAATNRHLFSMLQAGTFREDLYYRLRGFLVPTPALREHSEDIPLIANHLWQRITKDPDASVSDQDK